MIAYIFKKQDRIVFNMVKNVAKIDGDKIESNMESMIIGDDDDYIISLNNYNIGDIIPKTENNKNIKTQLEALQETVDALTEKPTETELVMLAIADLDLQREQDKIETQLAIAELAETILGGVE